MTTDYRRYVNTVQKGKTNDAVAAERALRAADSDLDAPNTQVYRRHDMPADTQV